MESLTIQFIALAGVKPLYGQEATNSTSSLELHFQQTIIVQNHDRFSSPYTGTNSLQPNEPPASTITSTLFFHASLKNLLEVELDPELAGGKGLSSSVGIAGFPNGDAARVSNLAPTIELDRAYLRKSISIDTLRILNIVAGKFSMADYFDVNAYSNSARTQFMNWALVNDGAWDYPANTRGYTEGVFIEYQAGESALRFATALEPTTANGPDFDDHISKAHGEALEGETGYSLFNRGGIIRALLFYNSARMGNYNEATNDTVYRHDITLTREYGRNKYGFGINIEQCLSDNAGAFIRAGWNDGQNETWAYTDIDRTVAGGITSNLSSIGRPNDNCGAAFVFNGISAAHRAYLDSGGYGFIIGDGKLPHYVAESIIEAYYLFQFNWMLGISLDYQFVANPAYNEDRGPVNLGAIRVHVEI
ncbi:MAG: carbohydrate porin [Candidatus Kryptoniota bacterium]